MAFSTGLTGAIDAWSGRERQYPRSLRGSKHQEKSPRASLGGPCWGSGRSSWESRSTRRWASARGGGGGAAGDAIRCSPEQVRPPQHPKACFPKEKYGSGRLRPCGLVFFKRIFFRKNLAKLNKAARPDPPGAEYTHGIRRMSWQLPIAFVFRSVFGSR